MTDEQIERLRQMVDEGRRMAWQDGDRFRKIEKVGPRWESFETQDDAEPAATLKGENGAYVALWPIEPETIVEIKVEYPLLVPAST